MPSVVLIDYGSGNLRSAEKALERAAGALDGAWTVITTDQPEIVSRAERVVLPGVGAFAACMAALTARPGLVEALESAVRGRAAPFLGICVGMQLLASRGLEFAVTPGLDWIPGDVRRLSGGRPPVRVPHMGWNTLCGSLPTALFTGLGQEPHMYFTHSFVFAPTDPAAIAAQSSHGETFAAAVMQDNLAGSQFHPEKSQAGGLAFLTNFLRWRP